MTGLLLSLLLGDIVPTKPPPAMEERVVSIDQCRNVQTQMEQTHTRQFHEGPGAVHFIALGLFFGVISTLLTGILILFSMTRVIRRA